MLVQVSRTRHFAWCDRCLRGSPMYAFDAPLVARFFAIEELRGAGWKHRPDPAVAAVSKSKCDEAERMWSGATYCPECAARAAARAANARRERHEGDVGGQVSPGKSPSPGEWRVTSPRT